MITGGVLEICVCGGVFLPENMGPIQKGGEPLVQFNSSSLAKMNLNYIHMFCPHLFSLVLHSTAKSLIALANKS